MFQVQIVEYDFETAYGGGPLSPTALDLLAARIIAEPKTRAKFIDDYGSGASPGTINAGNWQSSACALSNLDPQSFAACCAGIPQ